MLQRRFEKRKVFQILTKIKAKCFSNKLMKEELFKPLCRSFNMRLMHFIVQTNNINKSHVDLKAARRTPTP